MLIDPEFDIKQDFQRTENIKQENQEGLDEMKEQIKQIPVVDDSEVGSKFSA